MKLGFDIDHTVMTQGSPELNYTDSKPIQNMVELVNKLYLEGHEVYFFTARHFKHYLYTEKCLRDAGFKFHGLIMGKPSIDLFIDDRGFRMENDNRQELLELIDRLKNV